MLKIENTEVMGWEHAIRGMRNPKNSWEKSDSGYCDAIGDKFGDVIKPENYRLGPNDFDLMSRLRNAGTDHRKFMRMILSISTSLRRYTGGKSLILIRLVRSPTPALRCTKSRIRNSYWTTSAMSI